MPKSIQSYMLISSSVLFASRLSLDLNVPVSKKEIGGITLLPMMYDRFGWINTACILLQVSPLCIIAVFFDYSIYRLKIACKFSI